MRQQERAMLDAEEEEDDDEDDWGDDADAKKASQRDAEASLSALPSWARLASGQRRACAPPLRLHAAEC